jgi:cobalt-zinc-cadmium resistance protein CzcA
MIRPSVYGQAIIILVYVPLLTFSGIEGKMFEPMALTVIIALASAFILSLTFVPAAIAAFLAGRIEESRVVRWLKLRYQPGLDAAMHRPKVTIGGAAMAVFLAALAFTTLGQEFLPQLDEGNVLVQAWRPPGTSVEQSQRM